MKNLDRFSFKHLARAAGLALTAIVAVSGKGAIADVWPSQTVTLVVPAPPGGNFDIAARIVAKELQSEFGQSFIVENKPGAGGKIAAEYVKTTARDTTILVSGNFLLFTPLILSGPSYDWRKDFLPVGTISFTPMVLEVNPNTPARSVKELFDLARSGQRLTMASPGIGTSNHLVSEMLQRSAGTSWATVQYRGNAPATTDLLGGVVNFQFDQISSSLPHIQSGALRPLAVTSRQRVASLPNVPTMAEEGFPDAEAETFVGLFLPASGNSKVAADKLANSLRRIVSSKAVADSLATLGSRAEAMSAAEFAAYLEKLDATWSPVIKAANITGG